MPVPDDRSPLPQRKSCRNCRERGTSAKAGLFSSSSGSLRRASRLFNNSKRTLLSLVRLQDFFPEAEKFWSHFHEFIVSDEFDRLFQIQRAEGDQANGFIRRGGAHVGEFLLAHGIDIEIGILSVLANDHALV